MYVDVHYFLSDKICTFGRSLSSFGMTILHYIHFNKNKCTVWTPSTRVVFAVEGVPPLVGQSSGAIEA